MQPSERRKRPVTKYIEILDALGVQLEENILEVLDKLYHATTGEEDETND